MVNMVPWYRMSSNTTTLFFSKRGEGSGVGIGEGVYDRKYGVGRHDPMLELFFSFLGAW